MALPTEGSGEATSEEKVKWVKVIPTTMISVVELVRAVGEGERSRGRASAPHARGQHWHNQGFGGEDEGASRYLKLLSPLACYIHVKWCMLL